MASIGYRQGSKTPWRVRYRDPEGRSCSKQFSNKQDATEFFAEIQRHETKKIEYRPSQVCEKPSFGEIAQAFLQEKKNKLRSHTILHKAKRLKIFLNWAETMGQEEFSKPMLEAYYNFLLEKTGRWGRARKTVTANKNIKEVFLLWEWAEDSEIWPDAIPRPRRIEMKKADEQPTISPTFAEMDACIRHAVGWVQKLLIFLRFTGLRSGESLHLKQEHLDLQNKTLFIPGEISKTGIGRVVPLHDEIVKYLLKWSKDASPYLLPCSRTAAHAREARPRDTAAAWKRAIDAGQARAILANLSPNHCFRRGFKSGLMALGASPDAVDYLQGHQIMGSRRFYIDPLIALPLQQALDLIPPLDLRCGLIVARRFGNRYETELERDKSKTSMGPTGIDTRIRKQRF